MSQTNEVVPSLMSRWQQAWVKTEWDIRHRQPQLALQTARYWVGFVKLPTCSSASYSRAYWGRPYDLPRVGSAPAAPDITSEVVGLRVRFLPAGTVHRYHHAHRGIIDWQLGDAWSSNQIVGKPEDYWKQDEICLEKGYVLVTWYELGVIFTKPDDPPTTDFLLLSVDDAREYEIIQGLQSVIVCVFATKFKAESWASKRAAELQAKHDFNHERQCHNHNCSHSNDVRR